MNAEFVVADASVLLKWYLSEAEADREQALLLFDRFRTGKVRILLPELALYELGNRLAGLPEIGLRLFADALDLLTDVVPFDHEDLERIAHSVVDLRSRGLPKITIYDCAYTHLALLTGAPLITADRLQARAAKALGVPGLLLVDYR